MKPSPYFAAVFIIVSFFVSFFLTAKIRSYVINKNIIDIPNHRSAHTVPTPRGGGLAFVITYFFILIFGFVWQFIELDFFSALFGSAAIVAGVGYLDDKSHIPARWRLLAHFSAAIWAVYWIGIPPIVNHESNAFLYAMVVIAFLLFIVWSINLYNFMDGIDGIAGSEAVFVFGASAIIYYLLGNDNLFILLAALAFSVLGFLVFNFPPAKIFMGDAGSGFLGLVVSLLMLQSAWFDSSVFYVFVVLYSVFICDSAVTLLTRALRKQKLHEAHNLHAYQKITRKFKSHKKTTVGIIFINIFFVFPVALLVATNKLQPAIALAIVYIPLILLCIAFGSGRADEQ